MRLAVGSFTNGIEADLYRRILTRQPLLVPDEDVAEAARLRRGAAVVATSIR